MADETHETTSSRLSALMHQLDENDTHRLRPPADLWARIEQRSLEDPTSTAVPSTLAPSPSVLEEPTAALGSAHAGSRTPPASVHFMRRRRGVAIMVGVLAAAASIIIAVVLDPGASSNDRVLASAPLSNGGLASFPVTPSGSAQLISRHGQTYLRLSVADAPKQDGAFLEVWLIDRNIKGMVSLGPYNGNGAYLVPAAVDPGQFPVVDVSVQKADAGPQHSGVSVVRGTLPLPVGT